MNDMSQTLGDTAACVPLSELDEAVTVAYHYGARQWVERRYPELFARLASASDAPVHRPVLSAELRARFVELDVPTMIDEIANRAGGFIDQNTPDREMWNLQHIEALLGLLSEAVADKSDAPNALASGNAPAVEWELPKPNVPLTPRQSSLMSLERNQLYNEMRVKHLRIRGIGALAVGCAAVIEGSLTTPGLFAAAFAAFAVAAHAAYVGLRHSKIATEFWHLLSELQFLDPDLKDLGDRASALHDREPTAHHAVNAMAYNAIQMSHDRGDSTYLGIPAFRRITAHWLPWKAGAATPPATALPSVSDARSA